MSLLHFFFLTFAVEIADEKGLNGSETQTSEGNFAFDEHEENGVSEDEIEVVEVEMKEEDHQEDEEKEGEKGEEEMKVEEEEMKVGIEEMKVEKEEESEKAEDDYDQLDINNVTLLLEAKPNDPQLPDLPECPNSPLTSEMGSYLTSEDEPLLVT